MDDYVIVLWTAANKSEAERCVERAIHNTLAACVQIISDVQSTFLWKGSVRHAHEVLVLFKTQRRHFDGLCVIIQDSSSYEVPEIIAFPITAMSLSYARWLETTLNSGGDHAS